MDTENLLEEIEVLRSKLAITNRLYDERLEQSVLSFRALKNILRFTLDNRNDMPRPVVDELLRYCAEANMTPRIFQSSGNTILD